MLTTLLWVVAIVVVVFLAVSAVAGVANDEPPADDRPDPTTGHPSTSQGD